VMVAATEGRIAPTDTTQLLRACKMSFEAALVFHGPGNSRASRQQRAVQLTLRYRPAASGATAQSHERHHPPAGRRAAVGVDEPTAVKRPDGAWGDCKR
jgi:hypothetical protein